MVKRALGALAFACAAFVTPSAAVAQPVAEELSEDAARAFLIWMQPVLNVLDRAAVVNDSFAADWNARPRDEEAMRLAVTTRERARGYRTLLTQLQTELQTTAPFHHPEAPVTYVLMAETIVRDTGLYLSNMHDMLGHIIAMVDAMESNDEAAIERVRPRLMQSAVLLLDGQIVTIRARQQLISTDDSAYHSMGAMVALYEGMRVVIAPSVVDRAGALIDASQAAARWGASGRRAVAALRADLPGVASRERALMDEMLVLEERFYAVNDRVIGALEAGARSTDDRASERQLMSVLIEAEADYMRLNQRIVELLSDLAGAGVEL